MGMFFTKIEKCLTFSVLLAESDTLASGCAYPLGVVGAAFCAPCICD